MENFINARTLTYGTAKDGAMRLMIEGENRSFLSKRVELNVQVNKDSGEVKFFISKDDLSKLREDGHCFM